MKIKPDKLAIKIMETLESQRGSGLVYVYYMNNNYYFNLILRKLKYHDTFLRIEAEKTHKIQV